MLIVAAAGLAGRIALAQSRLGVPDSDEAVWGLMARHLLHGELTTFFWNQAYGGTQEVFLTAPVFAAFGSSLFTLRIVPFALNVVATVLVWRVGRKTEAQFQWRRVRTLDPPAKIKADAEGKLRDGLATPPARVAGS